MEEPTIYRARVNAYQDDRDDQLPSEEGTFKSTALASTVGGDTLSEKDFDIFFIPEGLWPALLSLLSCCLLLAMMRWRCENIQINRNKIANSEYGRLHFSLSTEW
jgi:hypothetical protein